MNIKIQKWEEIKTKYERGTILLGNGSSIAIHSGFEYSSLLELAKQKSLVSSEIEDIFNYFNSHDFELILKMLLHAHHVNKSLKISESKTKDAYDIVKNCLIESVRNTHPEFSSIKDSLLKISEFLKFFNTVLSLNYDLIIYWSTMVANEKCTNLFKDCFVEGSFNDDIEMFRKPYKNNSTATLVFYPHGHLALATDLNSLESKISLDKETSLIDEIMKQWNKYSISPLFVSEGTTESKIRTIKRSHYLSSVYYGVIPSLNNTLAIYGFGFGQQDEHILKSLPKSISNIAVSVHKNKVNPEGYCNTVKKQLDKIFNSPIIEFFDSHSKTCWIY